MTGWKTVIFGAIVALVGFLQSVDWVALVPNDPHVVGYVTTAIGVVTVVLRFFTSTSIGSKS